MELRSRRRLRPSLTAALFAGAALAAPVAAQVVFQEAEIDDQAAGTLFRTFPVAMPEEEGCPPANPNCSPPGLAPLGASMHAEFTNLIVIPGAGIIGGDLLEFDVTITNTSSNPDAILTAFAFQSKFSESPALGSRIGDKLFLAEAVQGTATGPLASVKKNGTSNGLFTGKWKGICINSSTDFLPEFNASIEDESLECAGSRQDLLPAAEPDGNPELAFPLVGLAPGDSQTIRLRLDAGTTDGALHRVPTGTITGIVGQDADGFPTLDPNLDVTGNADPGTALEILQFADNKVLRNAAGEFDPTFAPAAEGFSLANQEFLTFPRPQFAFTDILGRNHTCGTYGLDDIPGVSCESTPDAAPVFGFLDIGDLVPGVQNFAAILHGFGEYVADPATGEPLDVAETRPNQPYDVLCENCSGVPYVPIAEFYVPNNDGQTVTREIAAGRYGTLTGPDAYVATIDPVDNPDDPLKQEVLCIATNAEFELPDDPTEDFDCAGGSAPGGPPPRGAFGASAFATFEDLVVLSGAGTNGGDVIEFDVAITNTSADPEVYLTALNYQTKRRGLADINILDGTTQQRRDVRIDPTLPACTSLDDEACFNTLLGIGHFPNVIGNGLLFGQMVWPAADAGRTGQVVDSDQVFVDPVNGIDPEDFWLESVKKNGPFTPLLRGNVNFICIKSGLFSVDPDADAACAGQPADGDPVVFDADGEPVWTTANNPQRLGLPPGETQLVRMRMDFGDFRGTLLRILPGTLTDLNDFDLGLRRTFDCSDQRELEYCHPDVVGQNIGYLPGTSATWLEPLTLEEIEYVILNQPGDAPTVMNFADNFGFILAMAGFRPAAEFYRPDPNPDLIGTPFEGGLMREQVLGAYRIELNDQCPNSPPLGEPVAVNNAVTSPPVANQLTVTTPIPGIANSGWGCTIQDLIDQAAAPDPCTPLLIQQRVGVVLRALQQNDDLTPADAGTIRTAAFAAQCR